LREFGIPRHAEGSAAKGRASAQHLRKEGALTDFKRMPASKPNDGIDWTDVRVENY
jgi:hypothetical protein